jgi:hypothetical protein
MAATEAPSPPPVPEILERERRIRIPVGLIALLTAALVVVSGVVPQAIYNDFPHVFLVESLRDAAGQDIGRAGLKTQQILFYDDKAVPLLLVAVAQALVAAGMAVLLLFLLSAAYVRGATTPRFARPLVLIGAAASGLGALLLQVGVMIRAHDFATSSDQGTQAAHDVLRSGIVVTASGIGGIGNIALAAGFVMVALGAMRVGLLTRFLGVLGAVVGVLLVLGPLSGSPSFIVQAAWLVFAAILLLGRWPRGTPPAWSTGVAHPWPTQQEIREQRERAREGRRPDRGLAAPEGPTAAPPRTPGAARKKRKRRG